jgi:hypothetical protein
MSQINILLRISADTNPIDFEVDAEKSVSDISEILVHGMGWPQQDEKGVLLHYWFEQNQIMINQDDSFFDAGVSNGSLIELCYGHQFLQNQSMAQTDSNPQPDQSLKIDDSDREEVADLDDERRPHTDMQTLQQEDDEIIPLSNPFKFENMSPITNGDLPIGIKPSKQPKQFPPAIPGRKIPDEELE